MKEKFEKYCKDFCIIRDFKDGSLLINDGWGSTAFLNKTEVETLIENRKKRIENE